MKTQIPNLKIARDMASSKVELTGIFKKRPKIKYYATSDKVPALINKGYKISKGADRTSDLILMEK